MTVIEFEYLFRYFEPLWDKYYKYHTIEGKKRVIISYQEHKNAVLRGTPEKLFFILVYLKNNPLQTFQGSMFGISQAKVSKISRILLIILDQTLKKMGLSPCRDSLILKDILAEHKHKVFWYDGVEMPIQRNADQDTQEQDFSGKKHAHRSKNLVLCDVYQEILYLSPTEEGSIHDKTIADEYPINLPFGSILKQDLGFVGHKPDGVIVEQPYKKPKGKELEFGKKIYNKIFASTRIISEHANSGFKRLKMVKDVIRIHSAHFRDNVRVVACALHNLRVKAIDPFRNYQNSSRACAYIKLFSE